MAIVQCAITASSTFYLPLLSMPSSDTHLAWNRGIIALKTRNYWHCVCKYMATAAWRLSQRAVNVATAVPTTPAIREHWSTLRALTCRRFPFLWLRCQPQHHCQQSTRTHINCPKWPLFHCSQLMFNVECISLSTSTPCVCATHTLTPIGPQV